MSEDLAATARIKKKKNPQTTSGVGGMKLIRIREKSAWNFERSPTFSRLSAGSHGCHPAASRSPSLAHCHYHLQSQFETCIIDETRLPRRQTKRGRAASPAYLLPSVCARTHARTHAGTQAVTHAYAVIAAIAASSPVNNAWANTPSDERTTSRGDQSQGKQVGEPTACWLPS